MPLSLWKGKGDLVALGSEHLSLNYQPQVISIFIHIFPMHIWTENNLCELLERWNNVNGNRTHFCFLSYNLGLFVEPLSPKNRDQIPTAGVCSTTALSVWNRRHQTLKTLTEDKECPEWTLAPTCWSLGQIETVSMVNFRAAWLLAGDELTSIPTAETLILSLLCDFTLAPALPMLLLPEFPGLFFSDNGLILEVRYWSVNTLSTTRNVLFTRLTVLSTPASPLEKLTLRDCCKDKEKIQEGTPYSC